MKRSYSDNYSNTLYCPFIDKKLKQYGGKKLLNFWGNGILVRLFRPVLTASYVSLSGTPSAIKQRW